MGHWNTLCQEQFKYTYISNYKTAEHKRCSSKKEVSLNLNKKTVLIVSLENMFVYRYKSWRGSPLLFRPALKQSSYFPGKIQANIDQSRNPDNWLSSFRGQIRRKATKNGAKLSKSTQNRRKNLPKWQVLFFFTAVVIDFSMYINIYG